MYALNSKLSHLILSTIFLYSGVRGECPHKDKVDVGQCDVFEPRTRGVRALLPGHLHWRHVDFTRALSGEDHQVL